MEKPKSKYERPHEWVLLAKSMDTEGAYKDELLHEILQESKDQYKRTADIRE